MDFRTCPACKASVLEDDAVDCPFCGASMSGKPSAAKPKASPPAAAGGAKPVPAGASAAAKPSPAAAGAKPPARPGTRPTAAEKPADDDNPFDIDPNALRKSTPMLPKAAKGRTIEVTCPMCETTGYIAPQQQGKDVRCCNPDCKFPNFTAPKPKKEVVDENANKPKGLTTGALAGIASVLALVVGGGLYWAFFRQEVKTETIAPIAAPTEVIDKSKLLPPDDVVVKDQSTLQTLPEIRNASLEEILTSGRIRDNNPRKSLAFAWAAEGYAIAGLPDKALAQLAAVKSSAPEAAYLQIEPLVELYYQQRVAGAADATKHLDAALEAARNLPESSRRPLDAATALAAALVIADRSADAQKLLATPATGSRAVHSMIWSAAALGRLYDVDAVIGIPAWLGPEHPQWLAVTWVVASRGEFDKALAWANSAKYADVREGSLAVLAERLARDSASSTAASGKLEAGLSGVSATGRTRAWANFAHGRLAAGDTEGAKAAVAKAEAAFAEVPPIAPPAVPSMTAIYDSKGKPWAGLQDPTPARAAALAAADLAIVHSLLKDTDAATTRLTAAVDFAAAIAPSLVSTQRLLDECENRGAVEKQLDQALGLKGNQTRMFGAFNDYRTQCTNLHGEALKRFELEESILRAAARSKLAAPAWQLIQQLQAASDPVRQQPFFNPQVTKLPGYVAYRAFLDGDNATATAVESAFDRGSMPSDPIDTAVFNLPRLIKDGNVAEIANVLKKIYREPKFDRDRLDLEVLAMTSRYQRDNKAVKSFPLVRDIPDALVREDAFWLLSATAAKTGEAAALWKEVTPVPVQRRLTPSDRAALARGFIDGIAARPPETPPPAAAETASTK